MRCLALFTGGLDSQIAVRLMQRQGIDVVGILVHSHFMHAGAVTAALEAANRLQIEIKSEFNFDLLDFTKRPRFGLAEAMAPCLDCRIDMVRRAGQLLQPLNAGFIVSGEVVGQRPSSLRTRDLGTIAHHGSAEDLLLRPLSAQLLPLTLPERNGWVDRSQLFAWQGRGRKEQIKLAREWSLLESPGHLAGCALLEPTYTARLRRLLEIDDHPQPMHLNALKIGRHFWREKRAHLIVAKNQSDNGILAAFHSREATSTVLLEPTNFRGPLAILAGKIDDAAITDAANVIAQFSKEIVPLHSAVKLTGWTASSALITQAPAADGTRRFVGFTE